MLCDDLYYLLRIYRYRSSSRKGRAQESLREHQAVVKAMMARDPDAAETAMRIHLRHALLSIQSEIKPPKPATTAKSSRSLQKA
jgi:DNA-binding GntR family transcriptional regulator